VTRRTIDELLAAARAGLVRATPEQAFAAAADGGVIVDTRSPDEQRRQGVLIPGAVNYPLSVVLWRLDRLPLDTPLYLICRQGYSSSLAAAGARELGFANATDVIDGVEGWLASGLPVELVRRPEVEALLALAASWAASRPDVAALGLAGSWARDAAGPESDVDLILLTDEPAAYADDDTWIAALGAREIVRRRSWGALEERRLRLPTGLEVEVGVGPPGWAASDPVDAGTAEVVRNGFRALHDPRGLLAALVPSDAGG
jgi:rhodanese-related sulfurtransferase